MRVAIVHEWLVGVAGSEHVLEQLLALYPGADLFSLVDFLAEEDRTWLHGKTVKTSFLQGLPFARRLYRHCLPLMPLAVEQFDVSGYDLVISNSHSVAKGVLTHADQVHVSYVYTPLRYGWDLYHQYLDVTWPAKGLSGRAKRALAALGLHYVRQWDLASGARPDVLVAISRHVARRIERTYRRPASVIYPPVDTDRFSPVPGAEGGQRESFYVTHGRLVDYKRVDLIVDAFGVLAKPLVVIGTGPEERRLRARARSNVTFVGYQETETVVSYLRRARGFVFAALEDFGIAPVEAQACGCPVIAYGRGGARETVVDGETGTFFGEQTVAALVDAVHRFEAGYGGFDPLAARRNAERFGRQRFLREFEACVTAALHGRANGAVR